MRFNFTAFAALNGAMAVMGGAFAAHGLEPVADARRIGWLKTASEYQITHALAILANEALKGPRFASASFSVGIVFFAGALYGLASHGPRWLGAVAPVGGIAFIVGWLALAVFALRRR